MSPIPDTTRPPMPAAAMVITHVEFKVVPMYAQLAQLGPVAGPIRLVPVQAVDFYGKPAQ